MNNRSSLKTIGWAASVAVGALLLLAASCSDDTNGRGSSTDSTETSTSTSSSTSSTSTSSSPTTLDAKAEAQAALDGYWAMGKRLDQAPNPDDPELAQRAVDPSLSALRDIYRNMQAAGQHADYAGVPESVDTKVTSVEGEGATFEGCTVNGGRLIGPNGEVVNDLVVTRHVKGSMVRDGGVWKVQRYDVLATAERHPGEEVVPCDQLA